MSSKATKNTAASAPAVLPLAAPGGPLEIVFTFDTTGSMYSCLGEVRNKIQEIIERLFTDIPALRIAVMAHGDYCDRSTYITKHIDFTNDVKKLCNFVRDVKQTGGGDWEECYELVLRECREKLSWSPGTQRSLVMVGDAIPHPKNDPQNKKKIDWEEEVDLLRDNLGVRIYSVQAYENAAAKTFWESLATKSHGKHLNLNKMDTIVDMMMAICYREHGAEFFDAYEQEVRAREGAGMRYELNRMFDTLRDGAAGSATTSTPASTSATAPSTPKTTGRVVLKAKRGASKHKAHGKAPKATRPSPVAKRLAFELDDESESTPKSKRSSGHCLRSRRATDFKRKRTSVAARRSLKNALKTQRKESCVQYSLGKPFRELIPETRFALNSLDWSSWNLAMAKDTPKDCIVDEWAPRPGKDHLGMRKPYIFPSTKCKAVYEFAIQPEEGARKYPVYYRTTDGFNKTNWDTYLLRNERVKKQVDQVLKKGCKLFVRRAKVEKAYTGGDADKTHSVAELKELIQETYDYAWDMSARPKRREVVKRGKLISGPSFKAEA